MSPSRQPLYVFEPEDEARLIEAVSNDAINRIIVTYGRLVDVYHIARKRGYTWYSILHIHYNSKRMDKEIKKLIENALSPPLLEFLKQRSILYPPHFRAVKKRTLSRRDLLRAPRSLMENIAVPGPSRKWFTLFKSTRKALSEIYCPYGAIEPEGDLIPDKCTECGLCMYLSQEMLFENTITPYAPLSNLLKELSSSEARDLIKFFYDCSDNLSILPDYRNKLFVIFKLPTPLWISWYIPFLHDYYEIEGIALCDKAENQTYETIEGTINNYMNKLKKLSRRSGFFTLLDPGSSTSKPVQLNELSRSKENPIRLIGREDNRIGKRLPANHTHLRELILQSDKVLKEVYGSLMLVYDVKFDEPSCTLCGACEKACPFEAVKLTYSEEVVNLVFSPSRCAGCYNCLIACPENSIVDFTPVEEHNIVSTDMGYRVIASDNIVKCSVCGKPLAPSRKIRKTEEKLVEKGFPPELVRESTRVCSECKSRLFLASRFR